MRSSQLHGVGISPSCFLRSLSTRSAPHEWDPRPISFPLGAAAKQLALTLFLEYFQRLHCIAAVQEIVSSSSPVFVKVQFD